jgi:hypothetical protein
VTPTAPHVLSLLGAASGASAEGPYKVKSSGQGFWAGFLAGTSWFYVSASPVEDAPSAPPRVFVYVLELTEGGGCVAATVPRSVLASGPNGTLSLNVDLTGLPCEEGPGLAGEVSITLTPDGLSRSLIVGAQHQWHPGVHVIYNGMRETLSATVTGSVMGAPVESVDMIADIQKYTNVTVTISREAIQ